MDPLCNFLVDISFWWNFTKQRTESFQFSSGCCYCSFFLAWLYPSVISHHHAIIISADFRIWYVRQKCIHYRHVLKYGISSHDTANPQFCDVCRKWNKTI